MWTPRRPLQSHSVCFLKTLAKLSFQLYFCSISSVVVSSVKCCQQKIKRPGEKCYIACLLTTWSLTANKGSSLADFLAALSSPHQPHWSSAASLQGAVHMCCVWDNVFPQAALTMNDYEVIGQIGEGAFGKAILVKDRRQKDGACCCVVKEVDLRKVVAALTLPTGSSVLFVW